MTQSDIGMREQVALVDDDADVESRVRSYSRTWPTTFTSASGDRIRSATGESYLDFLMGAGALNYGHGNVLLREPLIDYLTNDGVVHSLDMATEAKSRFLLAISEQLLRPRCVDYKVQFTGPTGANAVEAALKLARKVTGRQAVVAFTRSFHGMSLGALAVTASADKRAAAGVPLEHVIRVPYEGFGRHAVPGLDLLEDLVADPGGGIGVPAAVIVETVQGEGGVNVAGNEWLRRLAELCARLGMLLIVDDVQAGCGRTGPFFRFERAGVTPDIVCLSKPLSGFGLPLAVVLFRRELDVWEPAEHNGTFPGSSPAFVTATAALRTYWSDDRLERSTREKGAGTRRTDRSRRFSERSAGRDFRAPGRGGEAPAVVAHFDGGPGRGAEDAGRLGRTRPGHIEVVRDKPGRTGHDTERRHPRAQAYRCAGGRVR